MARRKCDEIPTRLLRVKDQFVAWRQARARGERIPERLWNAAAKLAADYGVNLTANVLTLDYYSLKRRVNDQPVDAGSFIELPSTPLPPANECIIELEDGAGASMRMHFKGADLADIVALSGHLWNRG